MLTIPKLHSFELRLEMSKPKEILNTRIKMF